MCRANLYLQFVSAVSHNNSLAVTFHVFSVDVSTHAIFVIPPDQVVFVLTNSNALQMAGFVVVRLAAVFFPPSTETPTESTKSSGSLNTVAAVVGSIVGVGVPILLLVSYGIYRKYFQLYYSFHANINCSICYSIKKTRKAYVVRSSNSSVTFHFLVIVSCC